MKTKLKNAIAIRVYTLIFILMPFVTAFAQEDEFEDDVDDITPPPTAPIDDYILPLLVIAIIVAFYFLQRQNKINQSLKNNLK